MTGIERARIHKEASPGLFSRLLRKIIVPTDVILPSASEYKKDYAENRVQRFEITCNAFASGEEWGDEGPIYFIDTGDGNILYLCGQWLLDPFIVQEAEALIVSSNEAARWFTAFQIDCVPFSGHVFSIMAQSSEMIAATRVVKNSDIRYLGLSCLFPGSLASLEPDLRRYFEQRQRQRAES